MRNIMHEIKQRISLVGEQIINTLRLKRLLKPLYYFFYKNRKNRQSQKIIQQNGLKVLSDFHNCLTYHKVPYTLAFGTMLGAVREHGFIKHDLDIDTYMWIDDYDTNVKQYLNEAGFNLCHSFDIDEGKLGLEDTYEKDGVHIDIFFIYPPIKKLPYCCDFLAMEYSSYVNCMKHYGYVQARRLEMPFVKERKLAKFEDLDLYIPANAEELLEYRYGSDYMIPNPQWGIHSHNKHIVVWEDKKGRYIEY